MSPFFTRTTSQSPRLRETLATVAITRGNSRSVFSLVLPEFSSERNLKEISSYMLLFIDYEMSMEKLQELEINYDQVISHDFQISRLQEEYNKYYGLKMSLYDDLKTGLIDKTEFNEFREIYDAKCEELDQTIKYQKQLIREIFDGSVAIKVQIEDWKKAIDIKELDRSLLALTVDAIYVFEDKKIEIHFRYQDMVEKMKIIRDFCLNQVTDNMKEVV